MIPEGGNPAISRGLWGNARGRSVSAALYLRERVAPINITSSGRRRRCRLAIRKRNRLEPKPRLPRLQGKLAARVCSPQSTPWRARKGLTAGYHCCVLGCAKQADLVGVHCNVWQRIAFIFRRSRATTRLSNISITQVFQLLFQKADVVEPVDTQDLKS